MDNRWIVPHSPVLSRPFQTHKHGVLQHINQSINHPRVGLSLQNQHSPLYPLLSHPFRICIQSIYHDDIFYHEPSSYLPFLLQHPSADSSLLAILFFFFISSSIILPSPTLSSTTAFFILSVHFTCSMLLHIHVSNASSHFCSLRQCVQVSAPYNATLHKSLSSSSNGPRGSIHVQMYK